MKILMATSEVFPFSKSGGLADVVGSLPKEIVRKKHECSVIVPAYNTKPEDAGELVCTVQTQMLDKIHSAQIRSKQLDGVTFYFVCHEFFTQRAGIYGDTSFTPYEDNFYRFALFCKLIPEFCLATSYKPDIIHCHDWTVGILPYFIKKINNVFFKNTKTVFTIHNLAYQGSFSKMNWLFTGTEPNEKLFFNGRINMIKAGICYADRITTVSPTYAEEIKTAEQGCGLDEIIRQHSKKLCGIVNGIDTNEWNPEKDKYLPFRFSVTKQENKAKLKQEIQKQFNLPQESDTPLFAMISRLASQKGFDVLLEVLEKILKENKIQMVIIGTGDKKTENALLDIASRNENLSVNIIFSTQKAHLVEAGSDFFLMPSVYEPCGLNQLYSLRYGTIPVARRTGGLADTITDIDTDVKNGTGLLFTALTPENLEKHIKRAAELYTRDNFKTLRSRAMKQDFSWEKSCMEYIKLYSETIR